MQQVGSPSAIPTRAAALFEGILANDDINYGARLPDAISFDFRPEDFSECFDLCREVWLAGPPRTEFAEMVRLLGQQGGLPEAMREPFKHVRARFKHMRFAFAVFGKRHRYPPVFHLTTNEMGYLQDACNNKRPDLIARYARRLGWMLKPLPWNLALGELDRFCPSTSEQFRHYKKLQFARIAVNVAKNTVSPHEFHNTRKVVSRFRAFFVTMQTLFPSLENQETAKWLATLNGLMGNYHDELIEKKLEDSLGYYRDAIHFPEEIRSRLECLLDCTSERLA